MGYIFAILSALCFSITNIVLKKGMKHSEHNGVWIITFINTLVLGVFFFISLFLFEVSLNLHLLGLIFFIFCGLLINVVGRGLLYMGIRQIGSSKAVAIKNLAPVITFFLCYYRH